MSRLRVTNGTPLESEIGFSRAVRVGAHIFVGGTAPLDADGRTVGVGDVRRQAERCYEIVGDALRRAGAGWGDVVRTRTMLVDVGDWRTVSDVRRRFCGAAQPADTIVQVSRFIDPEWRIEIEVDAVVDGAD